MEMKIKVDCDISEKPIDLILTDEGMDNYNFVSIILADREYDVSVEDLYYAIMPFVIKKDRQKE